MSENTGQTGHRAAAAAVNESYSFACMRCGHGWEQSYEIEHHTDADGNEFVMYVADGRVVPSPLSRPSCRNCEGHVVRIMRAGQVSSVQNHLHEPDRRHQRPAGPVADPLSESASGEEAGARKQEEHHWHLSDLLHPFHRKAG